MLLQDKKVCISKPLSSKFCAIPLPAIFHLPDLFNVWHFLRHTTELKNHSVLDLFGFMQENQTKKMSPRGCQPDLTHTKLLESYKKDSQPSFGQSRSPSGSASYTAFY